MPCCMRWPARECSRIKRSSETIFTISEAAPQAARLLNDISPAGRLPPREANRAQRARFFHPRLRTTQQRLSRNAVLLHLTLKFRDVRKLLFRPDEMQQLHLDVIVLAEGTRAEQMCLEPRLG